MREGFYIFAERIYKPVTNLISTNFYNHPFIFLIAMKRLIQIILLLNLSVFFYGLYLQYIVRNPLYTKVMGSGVLLLVFVLMPLFLYYRYKDKSIEDYRFKSKDDGEKNN